MLDHIYFFISNIFNKSKKNILNRSRQKKTHIQHAFLKKKYAYSLLNTIGYSKNMHIHC